MSLREQICPVCGESDLADQAPRNRCLAASDERSAERIAKLEASYDRLAKCFERLRERRNNLRERHKALKDGVAGLKSAREELERKLSASQSMREAHKEQLQVLCRQRDELKSVIEVAAENTTTGCPWCDSDRTSLHQELHEEGCDAALATGLPIHTPEGE